MKRWISLVMALLLPLSALAAVGEATVDVTADGVTVMRNHRESQTDSLLEVVDYPTFVCDDSQLQAFLEEEITQPIQELCLVEEELEGQATVRGGYYASMDFEGLLSVEATIRYQAPGSDETEYRFFSCIADLVSQRLLDVTDLFEEDEDMVETALRRAVYDRASQQGLLNAGIVSANEVPLPDSYYLTTEVLRTIYDANTLTSDPVVIDLPWELLDGLTYASRTESRDAAIGIIGGADGPTAIFVADTLPPEEAIIGGADEPTVIELPETIQTPIPTVTPFPEMTLDPNFSLPDVVTPTPMPLAGSDAITVDVLTHGLWKPLGGDGSTYYQFTADGKLLTVQIEDYTVTDGYLESDSLSGTLDIGSDSAFTLRTDNGDLSGYVLNRQGEAVAPEEFVTPTPTPVPTPTPTPTPVPTPTPSPSPTPSPTPTPIPTPTLSPYQRAEAEAPVLAPLSGVSFEKARSLNVYTAPSENAWRDRKAQVTTNESVSIYGRTGEWVLVSYTIGNGSRGRFGYIDDMTLDNRESVPQLAFANLPISLQRDADATDDPLYGQAAIISLKAGDQVTLLAFMGSEWAYVETAVEGKVSRLFIPRQALMQE